ncbi:MAG: pyridoxal-phosphate dependent enzyme [Thermoplasmatales archaeon]|nr:MAG: pyridoxal-phosphate dependent enzyme [Thermoplasmatales archaeon]
MPTLKDVERAYERIKDIVNKTSVLTSRTLNQMVMANVFMKCENFQRVGAFKFRGVSNKLLQLSVEEKAKGVVTHSSGNHAQAVALASSILGIKSVIVMPKNAPPVKIDATRDYGAEIVRCASNVKAREETCQNLVDKHGYTLVHPYDDDQIIAGAGTATLELIKEVGDLDYMFCPVGGGGLLSGTSVATKGLCPNSKVVAVEPEQADDAYRSFKDGKLYPSAYPDTIADGLRTSLSKRTFKIIRENVDEIITVSEKEIIDAMKFLWMRMKIIVEPSGAVPIAGVIKMARSIKNKNIGVIISGGNIDLEDFFNKYYMELPD